MPAPAPGRLLVLGYVIERTRRLRAAVGRSRLALLKEISGLSIRGRQLQDDRHQLFSPPRVLRRGNDPVLLLQRREAGALGVQARRCGSVRAARTAARGAGARRAAVAEARDRVRRRRADETGRRADRRLRPSHAACRSPWIALVVEDRLRGSHRLASATVRTDGRGPGHRAALRSHVHASGCGSRTSNSCSRSWTAWLPLLENIRLYRPAGGERGGGGTAQDRARRQRQHHPALHRPADRSHRARAAGRRALRCRGFERCGRCAARHRRWHRAPAVRDAFRDRGSAPLRRATQGRSAARARLRLDRPRLRPAVHRADGDRGGRRDRGGGSRGARGERSSRRRGLPAAGRGAQQRAATQRGAAHAGPDAPRRTARSCSSSRTTAPRKASSIRSARSRSQTASSRSRDGPPLRCFRTA